MAKRDELQKTCKSLEAEYVASVTLAEKEIHMSHVIKANTQTKVCWDRKWSDKIRWDSVAIWGEKEKIEIRKIILSLTTSFCLKVNFVNFVS